MISKLCAISELYITNKKVVEQDKRQQAHSGDKRGTRCQYMVVTEGLPDKVALEQKFEVGDGMSHVDIC